jgi:hypothetical protein
MNTTLKNISDDKKVAVIQVGYQLLVSAKQRQLDDSDNQSIDTILNYCGFDNSLIGQEFGNLFWNKSVDFNPYEAFSVVSRFAPPEKAAVKEMLLCVSQLDNQYLRMDIASQLIHRLGL